MLIYTPTFKTTRTLDTATREKEGPDDDDAPLNIRESFNLIQGLRIDQGTNSKRWDCCQNSYSKLI